MGDRKVGFVFPSVSKLNTLGHISVRQINRVLGEAGNRAGLKNPIPELKNINPHLLRHSIARILKDAGMSVEAIQKILRHSSYKTTMDMYGTKSIDDIQTEYNEKIKI